ncbi:MAG: hypothetical protein IKR59_05365 [Lachnospiraceae bacterium]|nr:hypothetical protein [Lachnospiraceae bacterium]
MNNKFVGILSFAVGGAVGFAAANKLMKDKYEQLVQDEIDSVKAAFRKEHPLPEKKERPKPTEKERKAYSEYTAKLGYTEEKKPAPVQEPHIISPEEFGDQDEYDEISLTYYADGTVTDDNDRAMSEDEVEETIGKESLTHFGEYEDDSIFVRNDRLKADYEVLMDQRSYADVLREKPYLAQ